MERLSMKINLTPVDMYKVIHYSSVVYETKKLNMRSGSVKNHRHALGIDDYSMTLIGYMGEAAVCKLLGKDFTVDVAMWGDDGNDLTFNDYTMQIKTSSRDFGGKNILYVDDIHKVQSDILIGASIVAPAMVNLYGAMTRDKFMQFAYKHDFGYGQRDCVNEKSLSSIENMMEFFKEKA